LRLDLGIFALHLILTASFVVLPLALRDLAGLPAERHWELYLPVLVLSLPMAIPFILQAEKHRRMKPVFVGAIAVIAVMQGALSVLHASVWSIALLLFVFYSAFNLLEAVLPSLIAKVAPADRKGTAMGVYSSSQFFGAFVGTRVLRIGPQDPASAQQLARRITAVRGVAEAIVIAEDEVAYLKIDQQALDEVALRAFASPVAE
jgi:MFS family permease